MLYIGRGDQGDSRRARGDAMAFSSPYPSSSSSSSLPLPTNKKKKNRRRLRGNKKNKEIDMYIDDARAALAATAQDTDDTAAAAALRLVTVALEMAPRAEAAQELQARALLALRRYRDVADMLRDYIPSCARSCSSFSSASSCSSGSGEVEPALLSPRSVATRFLCCFDLMRGFSKNSGAAEAQWRYLVLGQACFHLGLMEDAEALLQTGRRLATAAFRRESVCRSEDSFASASAPASQTADEAESVSQLLAHVKFLLRRRAAAVAALDAGLPTEAVRHFNKVLDARRSGGVLPHSFATACHVGRAAAYRAAGRPADAIADCNRALALDPAFIPALRARADLLESIGALSDCLRDLEHLKLLYDAALRDGKLPGPTWRPQGGVRFGEIAGAHRTLTARIQQLRGRVAAGEGCSSVDYYALLGVPRGCSRAELERAHLLLTLKLRPDRWTSFAERLELVDEHRDLEAVRDQARMSALFLYRMLQKGYSFIMAAVLDQEAAERQRAKDAESATRKQEEQTVVAEKPLPVPITKPLEAIPVPSAAVTMATPAFQGVFCRDLVSGGGLDRPMQVKCQAMSC